MGETHLTGLDGTNPLAFFAALGAQEVFSQDSEQPRLWWSDDVIPHAVVDGEFSVDRIADRALEILNEWKISPALNPRRLDGTVMKKADELKLASEDIREYLAQANQLHSAGRLATSLVAEGSLDNNDAAKPSDLYFTAGQQKFLKMAREIMEGTSREDILAGLNGPWKYESKLPSLMWDVSDDRVYALTARDPSKHKKLTNPGPETLAILGMSRYPVFAGGERTLTQGCSGSWKSGNYSWPIWKKPASSRVVKSLLAHAYSTERIPWLGSWGVFRIMNSPIRRSDQGGFGTFGPSEITWEA